jgi:beta-lactamase regulating signal transducer with metallopeptidase domain
MLESYLISVVIKSAALLAAGLLYLQFLRERDAAIRHLICLAALMSGAAVPLLALWSPQWSFFIFVPGRQDAGSSGNPVGADFTRWFAALAGVWAIGALAMVVRAVGGWLVLWRARARSVHFQQTEAAEVRIADVNTPLTCGVLRPLILLPAKALDWNAQRLRAVLLHESAHVQRRDCLAKYVAQASRALLWWNPLAWMSAARLFHEQELACDEAVLSAGVTPEDYARALLDTAREYSNSLLLGCAMSNSSVLRARLEHLFAWRPEVRRGTRRTALAIPLLLALMTGVSCAAKRMPQSQIAAGPNIVSNARGAAPGPHK